MSTLRQRLRVNNVSGTIGANYVAASGTIDLGAALPAAAIPDGVRSYLPIILNPDTVSENVLWVTGPATSGHNYPVVGAKEGSVDNAGTSGDPWIHGPTVTDISSSRRTLGPFNVTHATASITTGVELFTPRIGDVIHNVFAVVNTPWDNDGAVDFGTFLDAGDSYVTIFGLNFNVGNLSVVADSGTDLLSNTNAFLDVASLLSYGGGVRAAVRVANSVPFCVSVAGAAAAGDVDFYVEVATPVDAY